jgi:hypothetical protein
VSALLKFVESWWWLVFIFGGGVAGGVREAISRHHKRRLDVIEAKTRLRSATVPQLPPEPKPVCGCSHHLSFHSPKTSACAYEDCRCQQYIGPEPLGHVIALPLVDPDTMGVENPG